MRDPVLARTVVIGPQLERAQRCRSCGCVPQTRYRTLVEAFGLIVPVDTCLAYYCRGPGAAREGAVDAIVRRLGGAP